MNILPYQREYLPELIALMYESVHTLCKNEYTEKELDVWIPANIDEKILAEKFSSKKTFVVTNGTLILAFADMDRDGYLNRLYTRVGFEGKGIGTMLLKFMESKAKEWGNGRMTLTSSVTARPFYEKCGYTVKREKKRHKNGQNLSGYVMVKIL